jgi:AcrR family transcriptional regulator
MSVSTAEEGDTKTPKTRKIRSTPRLTADDWVKAASIMLAKNGIDAVRVEPLAKRMKVTKGSFYWHFKDRESLLRAVLNDWRRRATNAIIGRLDSADLSPKERLHKLLELHKNGEKAMVGASLEMSIRQWAKSDTIANETLMEIDTHRHLYIVSIYKELGFTSDSANSRAFLLYSTMMGMAYIPNLGTDEMLAKCEQILLKETPFE